MNKLYFTKAKFIFDLTNFLAVLRYMNTFLTISGLKKKFNNLQKLICHETQTINQPDMIH